MGKTSLIIQREYLSRVRKKSFIVMSIVGPLLFAAMMVLPAWFASMEDTNEKRIAVVDQTGLYRQAIANTSTLIFDYLDNTPEEDVRNSYKNKGYAAYLVITDDLLDAPNAIRLMSDAQVTIDVKDYIQRSLKSRLDQEYLQRKNMPEVLTLIAELRNVRVDLTTVKLGDDGSEKTSSTEITMALSFIFAMMVYMFVLVYGTQVMRGVMEEKTNRIIEVIVSSVKPFQLMLGKIVGIAMVALTQFLIWVVLTIAIVSLIGGVAGPSVSTDVQAGGFQTQLTKIFSMVDWSMVNWSVAAFVYFFLGGYLLYAGMFAAIGSAIDSDTDSQQFVLPIMMPLILAIYVAMSAFRNPGGDLAFWFSMIPFTSPIVMMARIPFQIPLWEILLSMAILAASFVGMTWFAGRIYRTGILMYGKKVTYKEMWKWFKQAGK
ncbi:MAG: ABC transporter permease [Breznakibacter sp.]